ncbi:MAG: hypothetical protein WCH11_00400 [Bdellovibrio sp.]
MSQLKSIQAPLIVYQCYGREDIYEQVFFSVLSLLKVSDWPSEKIVLYTDRPDKIASFFQNRIRSVSLEPRRIEEWAGPLRFVHRVKLEVLRHAARDLQSNLVYLDGDTVFLSDPSLLFGRISPKTSLMHTPETTLKAGRDPLTKKIFKYIRKNPTSEKIEGSTMMWNAGVIGLHPENFNLLEKCLHLSDELYSGYQKHIMEQLAVSHILQSATFIEGAQHLVQHYWDTKPEHLNTISPFLKAYQNCQQAFAHFPQLPLKFQIPQKKSWWRFFDHQ